MATLSAPMVEAAARHLERDRYVYFVQQGLRGPVKIGSAENVSARVIGLQVGNPKALDLLASCRGGRPLEYAIHRKFWAHHIRGEWFRPVKRLLELARHLGVDSW